MGSRFGRYELETRLAVGGMGEVFLARGDGAGGLPKTLVVKRLLPHLAADRAFLELFLDEARIAARLAHPNVARVYELGEAEGRWYLAMEYVPGFDLAQVQARSARAQVMLPVQLAVRIAALAARGLGHAHRAVDEAGRPLGVVHRDVSPQNLLLSIDGEVKLIDFGIARALKRAGAGAEEALRGKFPYMSPEQAQELPLDHRSDQFSLGVVLWELLAGRRLFAADAPAAALEQVIACRVAAPSAAGGPLPTGLDEVVLRALEKDPAQRYPDTEAFSRALEALVPEGQAGTGPRALGAFVRRLFPEGPPELPELTEPAGFLRASPTAAADVARERREAEQSLATLGEAARAALTQLAAFARTFTVEEAEAVVDVSAVAGAPWVLDLLEALKEGGLLEPASPEAPSAELRFRLSPGAKALADALLGAAPAPLREATLARFAKLAPA